MKSQDNNKKMFVLVVKDKTRLSIKKNVLHSGYEGQNTVA